MEESAEDHTDESCGLPFTFPQVRPLYSSLRNINRYKSTRRPLKPLKCFALLENEENALSENQPKTETAENDSASANSLSHLNPNCNPESDTDLQKNIEANLDEKLGNLGLVPSVCVAVKTPFSAKSLVKRLPRNNFITEKKKSEAKGIYYVGSNVVPSFANESANGNLVKSNEKQDKIYGDKLGKSKEFINNNDGRVLRNIINYDHNCPVKKHIDTAVKLTLDSKCPNANNKDDFVMSSITHQKESGIDVPRKSPKAAKKIPAFNNIRSGASKVLHINENVEMLEKQKPKLSNLREPRVGKQKEIVKYTPSKCNQAEMSTLFVNNVQYSVLSKLGQGGSSKVYQVLDSSSSILLAVKCVNLVEADEVAARGYLKEIEMLSKLQSSNRVVQLIDHEYLKQEQILYVVMEKGDTDLSTLLKKMAKSGDVSLAMIIYYWTEMLLAVKEIHNHGIVHADLKPANFLLVCGRLKLIDFGIASAIQNDATSVFKNTMHGTCNYMSPEAIQDPGDSSRTKVGYKSDVWSLGCILYNLLYRQTPFQHITNNLLKLQVIASPKHSIEFPPVEKCPPPLMAALKQCLSYNAKERPTVAELLAIDYIWPSKERTFQ